MGSQDGDNRRISLFRDDCMLVVPSSSSLRLFLSTWVLALNLKSFKVFLASSVGQGLLDLSFVCIVVYYLFLFRFLF